MIKKKKSAYIAITALIGFLYILYFIFEAGIDPTIRKIILAITMLITIGALIYLYLQIGMSERENKNLFDKLSNFFIFTNKFYNHYFEFYENFLSSIEGILNNNVNVKLKPDSESGMPKLLKDNFNQDELFGAVDSLISRFDKLTDDFENDNNAVIIELKENLGKSILKKEMSAILLETKYYSDVIIEFMESIIKNLNESSEPLSNGVYKIKLKTSDFLNSVTKWNNDLTNEDSEKNFNKIIAKYNNQNDEFKNIFSNVNENYNFLEKNLNNISLMFKKLLESADAIHDIAESIRVLSINASIESVRAGNFGKGFKIVADEVKKLSGTTQAYIKNIIPLIKETDNIVSRTLNSFETGKNIIIDKISLQKNEFQHFYDTLSDYYNDFKKIFSSIANVINEVNLNIDSLVPIFHLSNLSIQEMENINRMIRIFLDKYNIELTDSEQAVNDNDKKQMFENLILSFKKVTTTEKEIDVINSILKKLDFKIDEMKKTDKTVELF